MWLLHHIFSQHFSRHVYREAHNFVTSYREAKKFVKVLKKGIMPISLRMLENRLKRCVEKINDLKEQAFGAGAEELGDWHFNAALYLKSLADTREEELDQFLSLFGRLPRVLDLARQVTEEEKRRRSYEVRIEKYQQGKGN